MIDAFARFEEIDGLLTGALELRSAARASFLARACRGDAALQRTLERLLEAAGDLRFERCAAVLRDEYLADQRLVPGARLAQYEIVAFIAAGGMGEVYRARDHGLAREVALKVLPADFGRESQMELLEHEAHVLASLNHPNVAALHALEEVNGRLFLVLEHIAGATLAERLRRRGALPADDVISIAGRLADTLAAAHAAGIVHRDLKPANVLLTPGGEVKVLDFGIALSGLCRGRREPLERAADYGTPPYMSPEQRLGHAVDARSDVWSLGCVMYEMLAGVPLIGTHARSTVAAETLRRAPARLAHLVARCLAHDPAHRPQTMSAVALELRALEREPAGHPRSTPRTGFVLLGALLLAFLLAAAPSRRPPHHRHGGRPPKRPPSTRLLLK